MSELVAAGEIVQLPTIWGHSARCSVCRHGARVEIESMYVNWAPPRAIESAYQLRAGSLRRHVAALGLDADRGANTNAVLGGLVERALGSMDAGRVFTLDEVLTLIDRLRGAAEPADPGRRNGGTEPAAGMWDTHVRAFAMRQTRVLPTRR